MKFDIARKIVKFNNGQFGIRRWSWFGYQFLDMSHDDDHWWTLAYLISKYAVGTEQEVRERLSVYLMRKVSMVPGIDKGTPV